MGRGEGGRVACAREAGVEEHAAVGGLVFERDEGARGGEVEAECGQSGARGGGGRGAIRALFWWGRAGGLDAGCAGGFRLLDGGALPEAGPEPGVGALLDEEPGVGGEDGEGEAADGLLVGGGLWEGDGGLRAVASGVAAVAEGALVAAWVGGGAEGGAEFHEPFVGAGGVVGGVGEVGGGAPEPAVGGWCSGSFGSGLDAEEDAGDVAVDDGCGLVEDDGGDGAGGVSPDAGQGEEVFGGVGDGAGVVACDGFGGGVEEFGAAVVAEARPRGEDLLFGGACEGCEGWEAVEEGLEFFEDACDLGLLEHDFGDEGAVGVAGGGAPREVACARGEPVGDGAGESCGAPRFDGVA